MKKIVYSLVSVIVLSLLGIAGLNYMKSNGPRTRVISPSGAKIIVEEMSYYINGDKYFGKVFKPTEDDGSFASSRGPMPALVYFHEPLKTEWPETIVKSFVHEGIIGYACGFRGNAKDAASLLKRLAHERFIQEDMVFVICDSYCSDEIVKAVAKLGHKIQGLILVDPSLSGKAKEIYQRYGKEFLTIERNQKDAAVPMIENYLEERGALK